MKPLFETRVAGRSDLDTLLSLNRSEVPHVGEIDRARLEHLFSEAATLPLLEAEGTLAGFVIGMDQDADYDSLNFRWFKARYDRFFYVDRIVVAEAFRRQGVAGRLYEVCTRFAAAQGLPVLALEYNIEPPNLVSAAFHAAQGFCEVGRRRDPADTKEVSMQIIKIDAAKV